MGRRERRAQAQLEHTEAKLERFVASVSRLVAMFTDALEDGYLDPGRPERRTTIIMNRAVLAAWRGDSTTLDTCRTRLTRSDVEGLEAILDSFDAEAEAS